MNTPNDAQPAHRSPSISPTHTIASSPSRPRRKQGAASEELAGTNMLRGVVLQSPTRASSIEYAGVDAFDTIKSTTRTYRLPLPGNQRTRQTRSPHKRIQLLPPYPYPYPLSISSSTRLSVNANSKAAPPPNKRTFNSVAVNKRAVQPQALNEPEPLRPKVALVIGTIDLNDQMQF
ncbi:hypothetical protein BDQ17DRAFT_1434542 [Cyathus striatus]|nr:hypothetical protein BDQ17DRAFT_1434542 [Cyathus striatus]